MGGSPDPEVGPAPHSLGGRPSTPSSQEQPRGRPADPPVRRPGAAHRRPTGRRLRQGAARRSSRDLTETMLDAPGAGLAAPQIGVGPAGVHLRRRRRGRPPGQPGAGASRTTRSRTARRAACPSPACPSTASGARHVVARGRTCTASRSRSSAPTLLARCVQHETDHLDGVLFVDRLDPETRKAGHAGDPRSGVVRRRRPPSVKVSPHPTFGPWRSECSSSPAPRPRRCPSLRALLDVRHEVAAVVTRPDAPAGRGRHAAPRRRSRELAPTSAASRCSPRRAARAGVPGPAAELAPDCCPVVAYGALVPPAALDIPRHGWVNLHFSLLPAWRGAARCSTRVLHGDEVTGATHVPAGGGAGHRPGLRRRHRDDPAHATPPATCSSGSRWRAPSCWSPPSTGSRTAPWRRAAAGRGRLARAEGHRRRRPGATGPTPALRGRPADPRVHAAPGRVDDVRAATGSSSARCARRRTGRRWRPGELAVEQRRGAGRHRHRRRSARRGAARRASGRCRPPTGPAVPASPAGAQLGASAGEPVSAATARAGGRGRPRPRPPAGPRRDADPARRAAFDLLARGARARRLRQPRAARPARASAASPAGTPRSPPSSPTARCAPRGTLDAVIAACVDRAARPRRPAGAATPCGSAPTSCCAPGSRRTPPCRPPSTWSAGGAAAPPGSSTRCCAGSRARDLDDWIAEVAPTGDADPVGHLAIALRAPALDRRAPSRDALGGDLARDRGGARRPTTPGPGRTWSPGPGRIDRGRAGRARRAARAGPVVAVRGAAARRRRPGRARRPVARRPGRRPGRGQPAGRARPGGRAAGRAGRALARPVRRPRRQGRRCSARSPRRAAPGWPRSSSPPHRAGWSTRGAASPAPCRCGVRARPTAPRPAGGRDFDRVLVDAPVHRPRRAAPPARRRAGGASRPTSPRWPRCSANCSTPALPAARPGGLVGVRRPARRTWPRPRAWSPTSLAGGDAPSCSTPAPLLPGVPTSATARPCSCGRTGTAPTRCSSPLLRAVELTPSRRARTASAWPSGPRR